MCRAIQGENAHGGANGPKQAQLILTFDPATFAMSISGTVANLDMAMAMLQQAARDIEGKLRAAQASQTILSAPARAIPFLAHKG